MVLENQRRIGQLESVPAKLDALLKLMTENDVSQEESEKDKEDHPEVDPVSALISKSASANAEIQDSDSVNPSLLDALNVMQPEPEFGEPINNDVAKSISEIYNSENKRNTRDTLKEKLKVPENCQVLSVPRVNQEIWSMLPPTVKQTDFASQSQQQLVSMAATAMAKLTDNVFGTRETISQPLRENLIRSCMAVNSILAMMTEDFNKKRKLEMKPSLNREYSAICTTSKTRSGLLFGDNIVEQLRATKSSSQLVKSAGFRGQRGGNRYFTPRRGALNYQGPSYRGAFRGGRNRSQMRRQNPYQPYQQRQHPYNRNQQ